MIIKPKKIEMGEEREEECKILPKQLVFCIRESTFQEIEKRN